MYGGNLLEVNPRRDPMLTKLPLIIANGAFRNLCLMSEDALEKFLGYLVRFTSEKYALNPDKSPMWWTENVVYPPGFYRGLVPIPYTRNKMVKLRRLVKLCYLSYNCKDLIILSEKLASLHAMSYKFQRNKDDTITVFQVSCGAPIVMIPESNLDYDLDPHTIEDIGNAGCRRELQIVRKPLLSYDLKTIDITSSDDDDSNCILIEESSDDDVKIISYEKGALPPTPPKKKLLPLSMRPGPACSKVRPPNNVQRATLQLTRVLQPQNNVVFNAQKTFQNARTVKPLHSAAKPKLAFKTHPPQCHLVKPRVGKVRDTTNPYLKPRNRPARHVKVIEVDLTIFDEEEQETFVKPTDLSKDAFLSVFSLLSKGSTPPPPPPSKVDIYFDKPQKVKLKNLSMDQVPFLVACGLLSKKSLASADEKMRSASFIEKYTRRDTDWFRAVDLNDKRAVQKVVRECSVKLRRLTSAHLRRWRKRS